MSMKLRDGRTMSVDKSKRHVHDTWCCLVMRRNWRDVGRQSSKPLRVGILDQTRKRVGTDLWTLTVSVGEPEGHLATAPRIEPEILMDVQFQRAQAPVKE